MARSLIILTLPIQNPPFSINSFFLILSIFTICSITAFLCASHKKRGFQRQKNNEGTFFSGEKKLLSKINSNIGSKAQLMVKMISWRKVQEEEVEEVKEDYDDEEEVVWRKKIMLGERCRPLQFSGKFLYDSDGKLVHAVDHATQGDNMSNTNTKVFPREK